MQVFLIVYAALSALILSFHVAIAVGLVRTMARRWHPRHVAGPGTPLRAEVIVALRNEERTLPALLASLRAQTRRDAIFLFVDDRSTDATGRLLDEFCAAERERARVIHNAREPRVLTGKQAALDMAFAASRGDVLLFTDGDCTVAPGWVEEMLSCFHDPAVGAAIGRIELETDASFLQRFQAFEQPLLNQYNLGSAGIGLATGGFGNNMAMRAAAVRETGGFRTLGYSVTEDAMLLDAVCRKGGWKPSACITAAGSARTIAKTSWAEYVNQHTRWNAGGLFSEDPVTRFFYILVVLIYLTGSLLLLPVGIADWRVPVLSLTSIVSIGMLAAIGGFYEGKDRIRYFLLFLPFLVFFAFFYVFVTLRAFVWRPFEWKGRMLSARSGLKRTPAGPG